MRALFVRTSAVLAFTLAPAFGCSTSTSSSSSSSGGASGDCTTNCEASGGAGQKVCGTDKVTYDGCAWDCGKVPSGVSIFPGGGPLSASAPISSNP